LAADEKHLFIHQHLCAVRWRRRRLFHVAVVLANALRNRFQRLARVS
jgi:hypothetical protein